MSFSLDELRSLSQHNSLIYNIIVQSSTFIQALGVLPKHCKIWFVRNLLDLVKSCRRLTKSTLTSTDNSISLLQYQQKNGSNSFRSNLCCAIFGLADANSFVATTEGHASTLLQSISLILITEAHIDNTIVKNIAFPNECQITQSDVPESCNEQAQFDQRASVLQSFPTAADVVKVLICYLLGSSSMTASDRALEVLQQTFPELIDPTSKTVLLLPSLREKIWEKLQQNSHFKIVFKEIVQEIIDASKHLDPQSTLNLSISLLEAESIMYQTISSGECDEGFVNLYINLCVDLLRSLHELHVHFLLDDIKQHLSSVQEKSVVSDHLNNKITLNLLEKMIPIWKESAQLNDLVSSISFKNSRDRFYKQLRNLMDCLKLIGGEGITSVNEPADFTQISDHEEDITEHDSSQDMEMSDEVPEIGDDINSEAGFDHYDDESRVPSRKIIQIIDYIKSISSNLQSRMKILCMEALSMLAKCCKILSRLRVSINALDLLLVIYTDLDENSCQKGYWLAVQSRLIQIQSGLVEPDNSRVAAQDVTSELIMKFGNDDPRICSGLDAEAEVMNLQGDIQGMFDKALESLNLKERHLGKDCLETARGYHTVANAAGGLGKLEAQKKYLKQARSIKVELFGEEHIETWIVDVSLANSLSVMGKFDEMKRQIEMLIPKLKAFYGKVHVQVARLYDSLANACGALGDASKMKEHLEISLEIKRKLLGDKSIQTVNTYHILANCNGLLGRPEDQRRLLEKKVIPIFKKQYGEDHVQLASAYQDLGNAYGNLGKSEKKLELLERAYEINLAYYKDETHFQMANILHNLANAAGDTGDLQRKKDLLEKAYEIKKNHFGENHTQTANTLQNLGNAYGALGDLDMMEKLLKKSHEIMLKALGPDHVQTATVMHNLAHCLGARLKYVEMETILKDVYPIFFGFYGENQLNVSHVLHGLAMSQYGQIKSVQQLVQSCDSSVNSHQNPGSKSRSQVMTKLVSLSLTTYGQAKTKVDSLLSRCLQYVGRAIEIREQKLGHDHHQTQTSRHLQTKAPQRHRSCIKALKAFFDIQFDSDQVEMDFRNDFEQDRHQETNLSDASEPVIKRQRRQQDLSLVNHQRKKKPPDKT